MRILIIGGTRFIGVAITQALLRGGFDVTVFHRGVHPAPSFVEGSGRLKVVIGDRHDLASHRAQIGPIDTVIDSCANTAEDAFGVQSAFPNASMFLALSSIDVYEAFSALYGARIDSPVPLTEESPLRTQRYLYGGADPNRALFDNLDVEDAYLSDPKGRACLLRLPVVYGPRDYRRREWPWICRVLDKRVILPMAMGWTGWLMHRIYVEDVAQAVVLSLSQPERALGQVYNIGERNCLPWSTLAQRVGEAAGGRIDIVTVPATELPPHLHPGPYAPQPLIVSTEKIRLELGFSEARSREENLRETVAWHINNPPALEEVEDVPDYAAEERLLERLGLL